MKKLTKKEIAARDARDAALIKSAREFREYAIAEWTRVQDAVPFAARTGADHALDNAWNYLSDSPFQNASDSGHTEGTVDWADSVFFTLEGLLAHGGTVRCEVGDEVADAIILQIRNSGYRI